MGVLEVNREMDEREIIIDNVTEFLNLWKIGFFSLRKESEFWVG